ncbi:GIY-YIG nuclease family protein [Candidatus Kaiserbacteria bacterium]|nr:GIY-YIG nuclease family protein [Candidatus Kaiserbacteria bacterium]
MIKEDLQKLILPDTAGVYFFIGPSKEILYIGKATSLRNRIRSYFTTDINEKRSELIAKMVSESRKVEWTVTDSTLEALILETNLIRTHKPTYNTRSKDDKSYNHLIITNEDWPRVLVVRGKDLVEKFNEEEILYQFGPFTSGVLFKEALKIIRKLFKFYDTKKPIGTEKSRVIRGQIDFNRQIGLYPNEQDIVSYNKTIRHIRLFFEGKKHQVIKELHKDMMRLAKKQEFELAETFKRKIYALEHIQDISLIRDDTKIYRDTNNLRIEAYDVAHHAGKDMVGVMVVIEGGEPAKSEYKKFKIKTVNKANDTAALKEILERRLLHTEWPYPQIIVVDGSTAQKNVAENVLKKNGVVIPVVAVVKDEKHRPQKLIATKSLKEKYKDYILLANAESHRFAVTYHRSKRKIVK